MKLTVVHATHNCADSTCPTIYQNEAGNYVIQGFKVNSESKSTLNIPKNEDLVEIPQEFLKAFVEKMKQ